MSELQFEIREGEPKKEDFETLSKGMLSHHASKGHPRKSYKYCIFLKSGSGKAHAGIIVTFLWNGMHIDSLWVDETIRNQNWGRKLIGMAEKEAKKRGCNLAYTDTFTWQASGFYEKLGYSLYGKLENFPKGNELCYYCKKL